MFLDSPSTLLRVVSMSNHGSRDAKHRSDCRRFRLQREMTFLLIVKKPLCGKGVDWGCRISERFNMDLNKMIERLKTHPEYEKMGMIASHLGVVRGTSRDGRTVSGIEVAYDHDAVKRIVKDAKKLPGIVEVLVDTSEGYLKVGDDILAVAVGGDIREHVFPALVDTVNRLKKEAAKKKERIINE